MAGLQGAPRRLLLRCREGLIFLKRWGVGHDDNSSASRPVDDLNLANHSPPYIHTQTQRGMKAAKTSAFVGGVDGGGGSIKHLEASLQQLLLPPAAAAAGAPLPYMPRSMLAGLLTQGLDAAAVPAVHLLTYRVLAQGKALAPHVLASPDLVERLVACVLSEVGGAKEEGGKHDGKENGEDEEQSAEEGGPKENANVGVWALRALLSTVTDAHLVVLLRYVQFTVCVHVSIHFLLLISFLLA